MEKTMFGTLIGLALVAVFAILLGVSGCDDKSATGDDYKALAVKVDAMASMLEMTQGSAVTLLDSLKSQNVITEEQYASALKINEEIARVTPQIRKATASMAAGTYTPATGDAQMDAIVATLQAARAANQGTSTWNKYQPVIDAILVAIITVLTLFVKSKSVAVATAEADASLALAKYAAHKQGVELTMKEVSLSSNPVVKAVETQLYKNIGDARKANGVA